MATWASRIRLGCGANDRRQDQSGDQTAADMERRIDEREKRRLMKPDHLANDDEKSSKDAEQEDVTHAGAIAREARQTESKQAAGQKGGDKEVPKAKSVSVRRHRVLALLVKNQLNNGSLPHFLGHFLLAGRVVLGNEGI